jgi:hypothetical protein
VQPGELGAKAIGHYGWVKNNQTVVKHITDWLDCQSPEA